MNERERKLEAHLFSPTFPGAASSGTAMYVSSIVVYLCLSFPDPRRIKWINKTVNREFSATGKFCLEGTSKASTQTCNMHSVSQNMLAYKYLIHFVYCSAFFHCIELTICYFSRTGRNISVRIAAGFYKCYSSFYQLKSSEKTNDSVCVYENIWATNKSHRAASSFRRAFYECGFRICSCNCRFDSKYYEFNEVFLCVQIFPFFPVITERIFLSPKTLFPLFF